MTPMRTVFHSLFVQCLHPTSQEFASTTPASLNLASAEPLRPSQESLQMYRRHIRTSTARTTQHRGPTNSLISSRHAAAPCRMQDMTPTAQPKNHQSSNRTSIIGTLETNHTLRPTPHTSTHQLARLRDNNSTPHLALP